MSDYRENEIDFLTGEKFASVSFTSRKHINRIRKLHEKRPEDFIRYEENKDGSVWAKIPVDWVRIAPARKGPEMTEERKAKFLAATKAYREQQASKKSL